MRRWRTTKDEKALGPRGLCDVASREKSAYTQAESGQVAQVKFRSSAASLNNKLTGDTFRHLCWLLEASAENMEGLISSVTSSLNTSHVRKV
jgi:hypothetical protein